MRERVIGGRERAVGMGEEVKCSREREIWCCGRHTMVFAERVREDGRRNEEVSEERRFLGRRERKFICFCYFVLCTKNTIYSKFCIIYYEWSLKPGA